MRSKTLKRLLEQTFGFKIYRGWYPRGMNLDFDRSRLLTNASPVVIDVGANVGDTVLKIAEGFPGSTIHACEPVSKTFEWLVKHTRDHIQVKCHQVALGSETAQRDMLLYEGTVNNSLKPTDGVNERGVERVSVQTLDDFCTTHEIEVIDYLKIDTEGFDLEVVKGGTQIFEEGRVRVVLAELGFSPSNTKHIPFCQFVDAMHQRRMSLFGIYDQSREFDGSHSLRRADCLFISTEHEYPELADSPDN